MDRHQTWRNTDPVTSELAGRQAEMDGLAESQRAQCLAVVKEYPGLTAREIEARVLVKAHKRLPELREMYLVHNDFTMRRCTISGKRAMTWWPGAKSWPTSPPRIEPAEPGKKPAGQQDLFG